MANDDLGSTIFGWVGNALALYFYIAPIVPFVKVIKGQMTWKQSPGVLLLCSFLNCILWSDYGLITNQFLLYLANGLGGTITLIYITNHIVILKHINLGHHFHRLLDHNKFHFCIYNRLRKVSQKLLLFLLPQEEFLLN